MSVVVNSNPCPDDLKKIRHDLGTVLGNLRAFESLFFSKKPDEGSEKYRETYRSLMQRLEKIVTRITPPDEESPAPLAPREKT